MIDKAQLLKALAEKKVSSCETGILGYVLGHLTDHGLTHTEIESLVTDILTGIEKMKRDPETYAAVEGLNKSVQRAQGA